MCKLIPWIALAALTTAGAAAGQSSPPFEALLARGDSLFARFENRRAIEVYEEARALRRTDYALLTRLSRTYNDYAQDLLAENDREGSERHFNKAVAYGELLTEHFPDSAASHFFLAAAYGQLALFKGGREKVRIGRAVESLCKHATELDPTFPLSYIALGLFYREVSDLSWLQRAFANALFGGLPDGSKEDAVAMLKRAIALDSTITTAHYELGMTYLAMDRPALARHQLEVATSLPPNNTADRRTQAMATRLLENWEYESHER